MTDDPRAALRRAMQLHASGDVDGALVAAYDVLQAYPTYGEAWAYIGNTLVTRKRRFADGLEALERASELRPDDPGVWYTLGWCREFAANALARPKGGRVVAGDQATAEDADTLYARAKEAMLHALTLDPEPGLRGDITDILDVIANVTGEPWTDEPR
jgi:tetratricopeptide (TPR) repeat protein